MEKRKAPAIIRRSKIEALEELISEQQEMLDALSKSELPEVSGPAKEAYKKSIPKRASDRLYLDIKERIKEGDKENLVPRLIRMLKQERGNS